MMWIEKDEWLMNDEGKDFKQVRTGLIFKGPSLKLLFKIEQGEIVPETIEDYETFKEF